MPNSSKPKKLDLDIDAFNQMGIMVDSGTTESFLPSITEGPYQEAFEALMGTSFKKVYKESFFSDKAVNDVLPTILLELRAAHNVEEPELRDEKRPRHGLAGDLDNYSPNDVLFEIKPSNYLRLNKSKKEYRMRLHLNEASGFGVLGANVMFGYNILFDGENQRIGFAKSNCEYDKIQI